MKRKLINNDRSGYSLIEILIVIGIFAVLSVVSTQAVLLSLRGAKKSESIVNVKEELDYASDIISRQLQSALTISKPFYSTHPFCISGNVKKDFNFSTSCVAYKGTVSDINLTAC